MNQKTDQIRGVLDAVEAELSAERAAATGARYRRARSALENFLETEGECHLDGEGFALLEAERQFGAHDAYFRIATPEDLVYAIPAFIERDRTSLPLADAQAQLRMAAGVVRFIRRRRLIDVWDHSCFLMEVDGMLARAFGAYRTRMPSS